VLLLLPLVLTTTTAHDHTHPDMQVLLEVMKRMDVLIFHFLVTPPADALSEGGSSAVSSSHNNVQDSPRGSLRATGGGCGGASGDRERDGVLRDPVNPNMPMLDDSMLFFARGVLTFGTGMNLKMACTR
jgi:hypothetical protein